MYKYFFKRVFDFILSLGALIVLAPVFLVLIILGWKYMKGNPFFTQDRPGKDGKIFKLIKFRSMSEEKDENGNYIPSTITLSFKDATLNKALAQYVAYEELMKNRTDNDYTLDSENKKMRLLMDQTQIKKPHK